ncbi:MAG: DUF4124 domain-containing protein [Pseudomonadota bacterium]
MKNLTLIICTCLSLITFSAYAEGKKIVKWVDSSGVTHYGDKLPSQESGRSNTEMSNKGIVLKKNVALNQQAAAIDYQKEQEKLDKERRDKILLASYTNAEEIDLARDRNLETEQAAIQALMQRKLINANKTTRNNKSAQTFKNKNQPLPAYLNDDLKQTQLESENLDKQIQQRKLSIITANKHYADEKARFIALKQPNSDATE